MPVARDPIVAPAPRRPRPTVTRRARPLSGPFGPLGRADAPITSAQHAAHVTEQRAANRLPSRPQLLAPPPIQSVGQARAYVRAQGQRLKAIGVHEGHVPRTGPGRNADPFASIYANSNAHDRAVLDHYRAVLGALQQHDTGRVLGTEVQRLRAQGLSDHQIAGQLAYQQSGIGNPLGQAGPAHHRLSLPGATIDLTSLGQHVRGTLAGNPLAAFLSGTAAIGSEAAQQLRAVHASNKHFYGRALNDLIDVPVLTIPSLAGAAKGLTDYASGAPGGTQEASQVVHGFADPFVHPGRSFSQHPLMTGLAWAGLLRGATSGAGLLMRSGALGDAAAAAASTERPDLQVYDAPAVRAALEGTPAAHPHGEPITVAQDYSGDPMVKAVQRTMERMRVRRGEDPNVARGARARAILYGGSEIGHRLADRGILPRQLLGKVKPGLVDQFAGDWEILRRFAAQEHVQRARALGDAVDSALGKGASEAIPLFYEGVLTDPHIGGPMEQQIHAEIERLADAQKFGQHSLRDLHGGVELEGHDAAANAENIKQLMGLLENPRFLEHPQPAIDAAHALIQHDAGYEHELARLGGILPEQARAKFFPVAQKHGGAVTSVEAQHRLAAANAMLEHYSGRAEQLAAQQRALQIISTRNEHLAPAEIAQLRSALDQGGMTLAQAVKLAVNPAEHARISSELADATQHMHAFREEGRLWGRYHVEDQHAIEQAQAEVHAAKQSLREASAEHARAGRKRSEQIGAQRVRQGQALYEQRQNGAAAAGAPAPTIGKALLNELRAVAGDELGGVLRSATGGTLTDAEAAKLSTYLEGELQPGGNLTKQHALDAGENPGRAHHIETQARTLLEDLRARKAPERPELPRTAKARSGRSKVQAATAARDAQLTVRQQAEQDLKDAQQRLEEARSKAEARAISGLRKDNGQPWTTGELEQLVHQVTNGRGVGYLSHSLPDEWRSSVFSRTTARPGIARFRRTGEAFRTGAYSRSFDTLLHQVYDTTNRISGHRRANSIATRFGIGRFGAEEDAARAADQLNGSAEAAGMKFEPWLIGPDQTLGLADPVSAEAAVPEGTPAAFRETNLEGPKWTLLPDVVAKRLAEHDKLSVRDPGLLEWYTSRWRNASLFTSPRWFLGNPQEYAIRGVVQDVSPLSLAGRGRAARVGAVAVDEWKRAIADPSLPESQRTAAAANVAMYEAGTHYGSLAANVVREDELPWAHQKAAPRAVVNGWLKWKNEILGPAMKKMEHGQLQGLIGRQALRETRSFATTWGKLSDAQDAAIRAWARGKLDPNRAAELGQAIMRMAGNWTHLTPAARRAVQGLTPFGLWWANSLKFVYRTLPARHPFKVAIIAALELGQSKQLAAQGQGTRSEDGQPHLQGGFHLNLPVVGGVTMQPTYYSPFGIATEPGKTAIDMVGPQFADPALTTIGVNPLTYQPRTTLDAGGQKRATTFWENLLSALNALGEGATPGARQLHQLLDQGAQPTGTNTLPSELLAALGVGHKQIKPGTERGALSTLVKILAPFRFFYDARQPGGGGFAHGHGGAVGGAAIPGVSPAIQQAIDQQAAAAAQGISPAEQAELDKAAGVGP